MKSIEDKLTKEDKGILNEIKDSGLSLVELKSVLRGRKAPSGLRIHKHYTFIDHTTIGVFSDPHIGQECFDEQLFGYMGEVFRKRKVNAVYQVGDILEGMSGREGQIYELTHIGFKKQIEYAAELFNKHLKGLKIYGIDGNHDAWYKNKMNAGVIVGEELQKRVPNYKHLGEMEADVMLAPNIKMKLFHPNDGTAYATSYKLQKLIESFSGGEKPNILLEGHYHKALYIFNRNIHALECGTLSGQTRWMRGKKIPAHKGFYILDIYWNNKGVQRFIPEFYPCYDNDSTTNR